MTTNSEDWDYFRNDPHYSDVLQKRLENGVEMDSAKAMALYINELCHGELRILDFGGGPGHYYPVIKKSYTQGDLHYTSIDIDAKNIEYGQTHFRGDRYAHFEVGTVLSPKESLRDHNCVISANTLPHVPSVEPLLEMLRSEVNIQYFVFRMLVGQECVQIKKHLHEHDFDQLFEKRFQFNNIYSKHYLQNGLGSSWEVEIRPDIFDVNRLATHRLPAQDEDSFYQNRVSRPVNGLIFKGDIYMPWYFVLGRRIAHK